jgi:hypothetical protein
MICPKCGAKMNVAQTIDSSVSPLTIREYQCSKGHRFIGQEELVDDMEELREKIGKELRN